MSRNNNLLTKDEIELLGDSLREIEQKLLKQADEEGLKRIWFQGEEPYFDIFFDLKDDNIIWFQFTFRGKSLSWDSKHRQIQTGLTNELKLDDVSFYAATKTIENDEKVDQEFMSLVKSILATRSQEKIFSQALLLFD